MPTPPGALVMSQSRSSSLSYSASRAWLVTGCSTGLGRALTEELIAAGHRVVATARDATALSGLSGNSDQLLRLRLDVRDPASARAAVDDMLDAFGRVDVLVNNAGYGLQGALAGCGNSRPDACVSLVHAGCAVRLPG